VGVTAPWIWGAHEVRVPRTHDEPVGKPRRVLIFLDGDAECGCQREPLNRRRARTYPAGSPHVCPHVEYARRWVTEPLRVVCDELIRDWGLAGYMPGVDRDEWAAHAVRRLQDARNADDARRDSLAARAARDTDYRELITG
jgi:hypothetical protein